MSIYAIGDLHLALDSRIEKPMSIFGEGWVDHESRVKTLWNEKVSDEDTVIVAGDISWGMKLDEAILDLDFISNLKGRKILIKGNHDLWWASINKLNRMYEDMYFLQNKSVLVESNFEGKKTKVAIAGTRGWIAPTSEGFDEHDEKIYKRELLRLETSLKMAKAMKADEIICVLHYPPTNDKKQKSGFTELLEKYKVSRCIYGHLHGKDNFSKGLKGVFNGVKYDLVSLDYLECDPKKIY